ncbi:MAG: hypothetical protein KFF68_05875, partial [Desulfosarcina sp.]|nr:hypothetical protein [Desulfosarcina sp.]
DPVLGSRKEIIPQYGAGCWIGTQAHPSAHIGICGGGGNAGDGPTDKQDVELFLSEALTLRQVPMTLIVGGDFDKRGQQEFKW